MKSTPQDRQQDEQQQSGRTSEAAHCRNAGAGNKEKEGVAAVPSTKSASTFIDMTRDDIGRKVRARPAASTPKESQEQAEKADAESDIEVTLTSDSSWGSGYDYQCFLKTVHQDYCGIALHYAALAQSISKLFVC